MSSTHSFHRLFPLTCRLTVDNNAEHADAGRFRSPRAVMFRNFQPQSLAAALALVKDPYVSANGAFSVSMSKLWVPEIETLLELNARLFVVMIRERHQ